MSVLVRDGFTGLPMVEPGAGKALCLVTIYNKIDTVQFPDSRIGVVGVVDCRAHVFNKVASPVFGFLMAWKLIFSCSPRSLQLPRREVLQRAYCDLPTHTLQYSLRPLSPCARQADRSRREHLILEEGIDMGSAVPFCHQNAHCA